MATQAQRTLSADTAGMVGQETTIKGWVKTRRDHGKLIFLDIVDRSGIVQVVVNPKASESAYSEATGLKPEYVVEITGIVKNRPPQTVNKDLPTGGVEIEAKELKILQKADILPFEISSQELNLELPTLLDHRSLTLRNPKVAAIFKVQAAILEGFRKAAQELGATEIVVPTIVKSATEGGAEVFSVDYYEHKAYLSQSPQLYKQMLVPVFERVWTVSKEYRAEPSVTTRHLTEITQMDMEIGFANFEEILDIFEKVAVSMLTYVHEKCESEFKEFGFEKTSLGNIPRLTLREAQEIIKKEFGRDTKEDKDLTPQDEIDICKWAKEKHGSDLVTVTHFPTAAKPFYTMPDPADLEYSLSYDMLFKGVEIMSGSIRINDYEKLLKSIKDRGMNPDDFGMYLMAFKYGMPPEGGVSFGLERVTMKLLGLQNIREASLFPRDMERIDERFSKKEKTTTE